MNEAYAYSIGVTYKPVAACLQKVSSFAYLSVNQTSQRYGTVNSIYRHR
jgi:hypothetical protein